MEEVRCCNWPQTWRQLQIDIDQQRWLFNREDNVQNLHVMLLKWQKKKTQKNWTHLQFSKGNTNKKNSSILQEKPL